MATNKHATIRYHALDRCFSDYGGRSFKSFLRKGVILLVFLGSISSAYGQINKERNIFWYIPSPDTRINGIAIGPMIQSLELDFDTNLNTVVNGISFEIIGLGLLLPIAPSSPIYDEDDEFYKDKNNLDSLVKSYSHPKYLINGLAISPGGVAGYDVYVNGLNLSGLNTFTGKMNGVSLCLMFNISGVVNGVSIGGIGNNSIQTKGLQIGVFNKTKRLRGFQIGLWNVNNKRSLPLINWNFKD